MSSKRAFWSGLLAVGLLLTLVPSAGADDQPALPAEERIVGGSVASPGEYPYQIALMIDTDLVGGSADRPATGPDAPGWSEWCGGSVIDPDWILTAAHCVDFALPPSSWMVLSGTNNLGTGGDVIDIDEIVIHPSWNDATSANDFALLRLARPVNESFVPLVRPGFEALWAGGVMATVTGWGTTTPNGNISTALREVEVPMITDAQCTSKYGSGFQAASMVCAGDLVNGGEDSCQGDSGGPLVVDGAGPQPYQVGVVSWGGGADPSTWCAHVNYPGIYSRVAAFYSWIKSNVGGPPNDNFASAEAPACGVATDTQSTQFATVQASEPNAQGGSVWYQFTPTDHGYLNINTLGSDFDTKLGLYMGNSVGSLTQIGYNDDIDAGSGERRSQIRDIHLTAGQTVRIQIDGFTHVVAEGPERGRARLNLSFDRTDESLGSDASRQFPDVSLTNPFVYDIAWMANEGITTGFAGCNFKPVDSVTRQSMAAFMYRLAGWDRAYHPAPDFEDVTGSHAFYREIAWMVDEGITTGFPDGTFRSNDAVTRQSMAAFMYRLAGSPNGADPQCVSPPFPDVPTTNPFCGEIKWLVDTGIASGFDDGTYKPNNTITRQAMAAFMANFAALP